MNLKNLICALLVVSGSLFGQQDLFIYTIPKSGTHLIYKYVDLLKMLYPELNKPQIRHYVAPAVKNITSSHQFTFGENLQEWHHKKRNQKVIFALRDLRDVIISHCFMAKKPSKNPKNTTWNQAEQWMYQYTVEDRTLMILRGCCHYPHLPDYVLPWLDNTRVNANHLLYLDKAHPNTPKIRFEKLVGSEGGGGDLQEQLEEISRFALYLGIKLKEGEAEWLAARLFGKANMPQGTPSTFRKGQVNSWKEYFSPEMVALFKQDFGEFLIHFGYEEDNRW